MKVFCDVDATLFPFYIPLYLKIRMRNGSIPPYQHWYEWDFYKPYISKKVFFEIIDELHAMQLEFKPFAHARELLYSLRKQGYEIVIATHRK